MISNFVPLIAEGRATDELTKEGCRRNLTFRYWYEILQEFQQPMGFRIFLAELRNLLQDRFSMAFEHRELEDQGRVEHDIRFFLERINPFHLSAYNGRATGDRLFGRETAVLIVTYHAAQKTDIGRRNPVMVINIDSRESRDEDLESKALIHIRQDARIKGMETFDD